MSKDARKVINILACYGITPRASSLYSIELICSQFFPNHIIGVIEKIMKKGNVTAKLEKAQDQGWSYFHNPVISMLSRRRNAKYPRAPKFTDDDTDDWARSIYELVMRTLMRYDLNRQEMNQLLFEIPRFTFTYERLGKAIRICKDRRARSIAYLHGILTREDANIQADREERNSLLSGEIFEVPEDHSPVEMQDVDKDWEEKRKMIAQKKALDEYEA